MDNNATKLLASFRLLLKLGTLAVAILAVLACVGIYRQYRWEDDQRSRSDYAREQRAEQLRILTILEDATGPEAQQRSQERLAQAVALLECRNRALLHEAFPASPIVLCPDVPVPIAP
jgi:hypothetical protein